MSERRTIPTEAIAIASNEAKLREIAFWPFLPQVQDEAGNFWWYDSARCLFVVGLWPIIENCWSEELVRLVAEEPGPPARKLLARCLLGLIPAGAS